jgi:hypothetical protein
MDKALSRREFIRISAAAAGLFALDGCSSSQKSVGDTGLPTLGGAPDTPEGRAIAALVDTVIPGKHRDPTGAPGGIDVGAPGMFFDPELPALKLVPLLVLILDGETNQVFPNKLFEELSSAQREQVLDGALTDVEQLTFAVTLAKLAYFSSDGAAKHFGYPGANDGYVNDPLFSFNTALTKEITSDGNLP